MTGIRTGIFLCLLLPPTVTTATFVAPYVDGLAGLGLHGSGAHGPDEEVDLDSLPAAIKRSALLIHRLTR